MENNISKLVDLVHGAGADEWSKKNEKAFESLFGVSGGRYRKDAEKGVRLRAPEMKGDSGIPFAAYVHEQNPTSGAYGGMSFVMFPVEGAPCLVGMVVGTQGLAPDEAILGRPGHARKVQAICAWLNRKHGGGEQVAWAKQDPTRIDLDVPDALKSAWGEHQKVFARYGKVLYAMYRPGEDQGATLEAVTAMLDLMFEERGQVPLKEWAEECGRIRGEWFEHLMPATTEEGVAEFLKQRRYVIVQGPPGTGKTRMALRLLADTYGGVGRSVQFHPNTTYENFVGGLAPVQGEGALGLQFAPAPGFLMEAAATALAQPERDYLLHLDEINRADLGKILGEAILLLEPGDGEPRRVDLAYDFGAPFGRTLWLPPNLHILGTMNTADRSIAIVDVAVRRRFGFLPLWPSMEAVAAHGGGLAREAFQRLTSIFVEHASEEALNLVPGHSYFLHADDGRARAELRAGLAPLLREYLAQGYVTGFAEEVRSYLQWLESH